MKERQGIECFECPLGDICGDSGADCSHGEEKNKSGTH